MGNRCSGLGARQNTLSLLAKKSALVVDTVESKTPLRGSDMVTIFGCISIFYVVCFIDLSFSSRSLPSTWLIARFVLLKKRVGEKDPRIKRLAQSRVEILIL